MAKGGMGGQTDIRMDGRLEFPLSVLPDIGPLVSLPKKTSSTTILAKKEKKIKQKKGNPKNDSLFLWLSIYQIWLEDLIKHYYLDKKFGVI